MQRRRRSTPHNFDDRIEAEKKRLEVALTSTPPGKERDALVKKLESLKSVSQMDLWLRPPAAKPSK
jgi:hypothetical protein